MHERGWIHCDVKPDNFLADKEGNVKLIDFSIGVKAKKKGGLSGLFGGRPQDSARNAKLHGPRTNSPQVPGMNEQTFTDWAAWSTSCLLARRHTQPTRRTNF